MSFSGSYMCMTHVTPPIRNASKDATLEGNLSED